jgi:hypothetical protein
MDCLICTEPFTAVARKKISCPKCNKDTCIKCVQRYLLSSLSDPHCLHCKHGFSRMFLQTNLTKTFIDKDYAKHRGDVLWKREESYIPNAQVKAERIVRGKAMRNEKFTEVRKEIDKINEQIRILNASKSKFTAVINQHYEDMTRLLSGEPTVKELRDAGEKVEDLEKKERKKFVRKCGFTDCKGWLNTHWKCGICENHTCSDCFIITGKHKECGHTCKPEDVETANLIKKSCKGCPNCGQMIEKKEGCDQIFCTACHTAFDWNTLKTIKLENVHNPHYFEWRNKNNNGAQERTPGDIPCGGLPHDNFLYRIIRNKHQLELTDKYRFTRHVQQVELNRYRETNEDTDDLRVKYLLKEVSKEEIQRLLQNRERKNERNKAVRDVLDTYVVAASEQFRIFADEVNKRFIENKNTLIRIDDLHMVIQTSKFNEQMNLLRDFINKTLIDVSKVYGCVVPQINEEWTYLESDSASKMKEREKEEAKKKVLVRSPVRKSAETSLLEKKSET